MSINFSAKPLIENIYCDSARVLIYSEIGSSIGKGWQDGHNTRKIILGGILMLSEFQGGITEVFITKVAPGKEEEYRSWILKVHQVEATFPGFIRVYVQPPVNGKGHNWITLLEFDTSEHLDQWLVSPERQALLGKSLPLVEGIESHRIISPYAGWFAAVTKEGEAPPVWKQTMLVLLVLFPIVMLEGRFLSAFTINLNPSAATFIANAISVSLIAWPAMPIAIWFLGWWLSPTKTWRLWYTFLGIAILTGLYLLEIAIFWKL